MYHSLFIHELTEGPLGCFHVLTTMNQAATNIFMWKFLCGHNFSTHLSKYQGAQLLNLTVRYWRGQWHPTPVLLPGKSHGRRSLVGGSPWGHTKSDTTERFHFHFSLSGIGEGNGNPLQYSCLENPRDRGAWWAAVYGVAQSRTRLKRLSSSSSSMMRYV